MSRLGPAVVALLMLLTGCSGTHGPTTSLKAIPAPGTWGVVFDRPLTLEGAKALAARRGAVLVALWRTESPCVTDVGLGRPETFRQGGRRHSPFAYIDADDLVARQAQGPPVTDDGWSFAMRARFVEEWDAAQHSDVLLRGGALLVPAGASLRGDGIKRSAPVESYRTDGVGVLYLRGHQAALAPLFPGADTSPC